MSKVIDSFKKEYFFLSNFYRNHDPLVDMTYDDIKYPTVEHAYQAAKTLNRSERMRISELITPGEAKLVGRHLQLRDQWEGLKFPFMGFYLRQKFHQPKMRKLLLETGDAILIEGNDWGDRIWGQVNGEGENHLGKLLMMIREEIKEE